MQSGRDGMAEVAKVSSDADVKDGFTVSWPASLACMCPAAVVGGGAGAGSADAASGESWCGPDGVLVDSDTDCDCDD